MDMDENECRHAERTKTSRDKRKQAGDGLMYTKTESKEVYIYRL